MSVFRERAELIDHLVFKLGTQRGRLAACMDILTDLTVVLGTHTAYCQKGKSDARPAADIRVALQQVAHVKELIATLLGPRPGASTGSPARG